MRGPRLSPLRYCLICNRLTLRGLFPGYWHRPRVHPWCLPKLRRAASGKLES